MIKEIKYSGHTASASDYLAPDGELIASMGLVPEDGSLKPVQPPHCVLSLAEGQKVMCVHETSSSGTHYIVLDSDNKLYYRDIDGELSDSFFNFGTYNVYSVKAIGNTIFVLTSNGVYYFQYLSSEGYRPLGNHLPELPIEFGLQGFFSKNGIMHSNKCNFSIEHEFQLSKSGGATFTEGSDEEKAFTESTLANVNKFIQSANDDNKFLFPFFVRYAFRLYDGSITMQSAPVLMLASTDIAPHCYIASFEAEEGEYYYNVRKINISVGGMLSQLDYVVSSESAITALNDWRDIITSVDIFVSKPIYTYDQNGKVLGIEMCNQGDTNDTSYTIAKQFRKFNHLPGTVAFNGVYRKATTMQRFDAENGNVAINHRVVKIPQRDDVAVFADIRDCHDFYYYASIPIEKLALTRTVVVADEGRHNNLVTQEVMTDDYDSHCRLLAKYAYNYNARVNLTDLQKELYSGYYAPSSFIKSTYSSEKTLCIYYYIKKDGVIHIVKSDAGFEGTDNPLVFLYYPDTNAYKAVIVEGGGAYETQSIYEVSLKPHATLNGAYYFEGWEDLRTNATQLTTLPVATTDNIIDIRNKIYTSEVNNPFYFPLLGINTVGSGVVMGVCSAAKALSQGQFGQFPLYAFTTEGVWALTVSDTGSYSAKQPITRDVCTSAESITQLDSAVLFATDRGIMLISGSDSQCITDTIDNMLALDDAAELPLLTSVMTQYGYNYQMKFAPLHKFLVGSRMLYAYVPQRIIIYNPQYDYAYVYSLKSKAWGMMPSTIKSNVPSYPEALAMLSNNKLVDFCENEVDANNKYITPYKGMLITRPLKLDMPDTLKTIDTVIQRGEFEKGHVKTLCYGSRDLYNWFYVNSSKDHYLRGFRGTPYKYFKLVSLCSMDVGETLSGATVQHTPREINQPR